MKPVFTITNHMINLIFEMSQKLTRLEIEQERQLHLRKENRIRSIHSSLAIEKNSLSLEQVTDIINGKRVFGQPQEIKEVQNAYEAYNHLFTLNPYDITDFLSAHKLMTQGLIKESGQFRKRDVGVYDSAGNVIHVGARPQFVPNLIEKLFNWARETDVFEPIKSCVMHFEIEIIHPFADGNGRMGRVWQNLILARWNPVFEWIPVETIVYENQQRYYDTLEICNKKNDSTEFIEFMLEVILLALQEYDDPNYKELIATLNQPEQIFFGVIQEYLKSHQTVTAKVASQLSNRPIGTVRRYLVKFVDIGLLELTGSNRDRQYYLKN